MEALIVCFLLLAHEDALVHQGCQSLEHIELALIAADADRLYLLCRTSPGKDRESPKEGLLRAVEEVVAPGKGVAQRLLARRHFDRPSGQHLQPPLQPSEQRLWGQDAQAGRGQFDAQRQTVHTSADLGHGTGVLLGNLKGGLDQPSTLEKERHARIPQ